MMYKYNMTIDHDFITAVFFDHFEAADFLDETEREEHCEIIVHGYEEITMDELLEDNDFESCYKLELLGILLLPNHKELKKDNEIRKALRDAGFDFHL